MKNSLARSKYEAQLAVAARALLRASDAASDLNDHGSVDDLWKLREHLRAMLEHSVSGRTWRSDTTVRIL